MSSNGVHIFDHLPIMRSLCQKHASLAGSTEEQQLQSNMWLDIISQQVYPSAKRVISQCNGSQKVTMDIRQFSMA